jgi:hypothetical protein
MKRPRLYDANFQYLLVGLLLFLLAVPTLRILLYDAENEFFLRHAVGAVFALMLLVGVWGIKQERRLFRHGIRLIAAQAAFSGAALIEGLGELELAARLLGLSFCVASTGIAGAHVFRFQRVDRNLLAGAVCVYLLLGIIFAIVYSLIAYFWPTGAFSGIDPAGRPLAFDDLLYFSFTTMTTVGYGDITPVNPLLRTLAYFQMVTGQFYMAVLVASLVGVFLMNRDQP